MLTFLWICIFISIYLYFFREWFLAELAISFLPYIIVCCWIASIVWIILIFYYNHKRNKFKNLKVFFSTILLILSLWIWYLYYSEFFSFYNKPSESVRLESDEWIKVFYANILYKNADFKSLQNAIESEDPDIVILVEFSDEHEDEMKDFFQKKYPYVNRTSRSITLAWNVIFSKIPLENKTETYLKKYWSRSYWYVNLQCKDFIPHCENGIDLYVIHTAAPVSLENFQMRNEQLQKFSTDLMNQDNGEWLPTMVIWDFNLSPWSYYYSQLTKYRDLKNALSYQEPNYTRSLLQQWIFRSHIDQLFISNWIKISPIEINNLSGSDHRSFSFNIWL